MRIIAGTARGRRVEAPPGRDTRPTLDRVRENLFNILQNRVREARVLDLFAGSGALSLEALSRGAAFAVLGDRDRKAHLTEKKNIEVLGFQEKTRVMLGDWRQTVNALGAEGTVFDLIFLDPPYEMTDLREITEALLPLMAEDARVIIEHEAKQEIRAADGLERVDERRWGYCGVGIYRLADAKGGTDL